MGLQEDSQSGALSRKLSTFRGLVIPQQTRAVLAVIPNGMGLVTVEVDQNELYANATLL